MKIRKTITIDGTIHELSDAFLAQVLETAVDGACSYWADVSAEDASENDDPDGARDYDLSDYIEGNNRGGDSPYYTAASFLVSKNSTQGGTLDLEGVADSIERIASGEVDVAAAIREIIVAAVRDDDASDIDSEAADCIVQIGLFDEIVFS
ncbi:hypothetical protein [Noviherbaspirillum sp.]|uniref:hypothetical protein n=1 Tax=Noviherbaspirillum sp. TaxID=1926288 RepID=UPI002FE22846